MRYLFLLYAIPLLFAACTTARPGETITTAGVASDTLITHSLFSDKGSTISEEGIQRILSGTYKLPQQLRVAIVKLEHPQARRSWSYWSDEDYLKTQQSYLDLFSEKFRQSPRVTRLSIVPDLLVSRTPSFTNIREAAVRMQADVVVVYAITSDIYSKYKLFSRPDIKAFATTQLIVLDVRTGLVPFSSIVTRDYLSQRSKEELNVAEARSRVQHEAVLLTISETGERITQFLNTQ